MTARISPRNYTIGRRSGYPDNGLVQFDVTASNRTECALSFRIPEWAEGASISVNGRRADALAIPGAFAAIRRRWRPGDWVEVNLPMTMRLEPVDQLHPDIVALVCGPLVLFAITDSAPTVTRRQLLAARKVGAQQWRVETAEGPLKMLPFTAISEEQYSTYLQL